MNRFALAVCLVSGFGVFPLAHAAWPPPVNDTGFDYSDPANWPNDPSFSGNWDMWSFVPEKMKAQVDEVSRRLGAGGHYDRAWAKTRGDSRVVIAILDSGIEWSNGDLINRHYLNPAELPVSSCPPAPGASDHDVNGDGRFNVQDYTTTKGAELPAFGKVCDPRITQDVNGNGVLDPQDLIAVFSDGTDGDGNGYVDDISGWDFLFNDNDPADATFFGHGSGRGREAAAQGNDGRGGIGVCPDCTLLSLRLNDSFVVEANQFAMATIYATDQGVSVVGAAIGSVDNTPLSRAAIDYAYDNNVFFVASAADEDSFHHNFPSTNNHANYFHAITHDATNLDSSTTFFAFSNCTNYGAQLMFSVPSTSCSSGSTGKGSGLVGLIYSAALQSNIPIPRLTAGDPAGNRRLTAEEVRQLMVTTVDNFYDPADATNPLKYPTNPGWMRRFGYGRPNLRGAVDAVIAGQIPPEVDILSPGHFDVIYPDRSPTVPIMGRVGIRGVPVNPTGVTFDYVVEYAPGVDPPDGAFKTIGSAELQTTAVAGPLAMWDVSALQINNPVPAPTDPSFQPDDPANVRLVTLRVRATMHSSNPMLEGLTGEGRRAVHIERDPDLLAGFPINLGASGEASLKIADLNGDKQRELIVADAAGRVHAFRANGTELPGWPVQVHQVPWLDPATKQGQSHASAPAFSGASPAIDPAQQRSAIMATPAIGDVDGDGRPEVIVATANGQIYALRSDGSVVTGFPVAIDLDSAALALGRHNEIEDGVFAAPALADLDGDKKLDIVVAALDAKVYAWKGDGTRLRGFPVIVQDGRLPEDEKADEPRQRQRLMSSPAIGDLNGDGLPDIVVGSNENYTNSGRLYVVDGRGNTAPGGPFLPGWPVAIVSTRVLPMVGQGLPNAPALADIDGDGKLDVVVAGVIGVPRALNAQGKPVGAALVNQRGKYGEKSDALNEITIVLVANPALGDVDDDGVPDIIQPTGGGDAALAFASGGIRRDFEHHVAVWDSRTGQFKRGFPRVIEDWQFFLNPLVADLDDDGKVEVINGSAGYFVHAWNVDGVEPKGFPKLTGGWIAASPVVGDLDGDGKLELAASTRNGYLFAWHTRGRSTGRIDWPSFHHDNWNTGNLSTPLEEGVSATPGCTIAGVPTPGSTAALGILLALLGLALHLARRATRRRLR